MLHVLKINAFHPQMVGAEQVSYKFIKNMEEAAIIKYQFEEQHPELMFNFELFLTDLDNKTITNVPIPAIEFKKINPLSVVKG